MSNNIRYDCYETLPIEEVREKHAELDRLVRKAKDTRQSGAEGLFSYGRDCLAEILIRRGDKIKG